MASLEFKDEIRQLLNDMPMSIVDMSEKQMLTCILYTLYELNKHVQHVEIRIARLQKQADKPKVKLPT